MKTRFLVASFLTVSILFLWPAPAAQAKTASCPCSPCKCSPCTCGGGGKSSGGSGKGESKRGGGKHHDRHGHRDHGGGSSVGVGASVDLGGVGQRRAESDPFAAGNDKPVAHTEEKPKAKKNEHEPTTSSFDEIKLTGPEAKDENAPNTFNVNNDETEPAPKTTDAATELKKAHDAYHSARTEWLKKQPNYNQLVHDWTQSSNTEEGNKKSAKAKKKVEKMIDQFDKGDGKDLVDDWKKAFDNTLKSGGTVDDNKLVPPAKDDIEKKKYAVIKAQNDLKFEQKQYDDRKNNAANQDEEVKKAQQALQNFKSTNDPGYKGAMADLDQKVKEAGAKWASTEEGKKQIQKVKDAEKELDKAKDAWKPFEKYVEK